HTIQLQRCNPRAYSESDIWSAERYLRPQNFAAFGEDHLLIPGPGVQARDTVRASGRNHRGPRRLDSRRFFMNQKMKQRKISRRIWVHITTSILPATLRRRSCKSSAAHA